MAGRVAFICHSIAKINIYWKQAPNFMFFLKKMFQGDKNGKDRYSKKEIRPTFFG